jgi:hypothetical protein
MRFLAALAFASLLSSVAVARAESPRAGRAMWLRGESPGVWVGPRALWTPSTGHDPLSACASGHACVPITEHRSCTVPECPGDGFVHTVATDVARVGAFPQDYGGYQHEIEELRADTRLSSIAGNFRDHPQHAEQLAARQRAEEAQRREEERHRESVRWVSDYRRGDRWELSLQGSLATLAQIGGSFAGGTAGLSFVFLEESDDADEHDEESSVLGALFGDTLGAELRVSALARIDGGQEAQWFASVGIAPMFVNRYEHTVVRLPSFIGTIAPEIGAIFRSDRDPTWYVGWSAPVSFLLTHDVALDVTPRLLLVDDWIPKPSPDSDDDPAEVVVMLSAGLRLP